MGHLQEDGFEIADIQEADHATMLAVRERLGVPADAKSCHTATVGPYVIEGHVPTSAIRRLLRESPEGVMGLAVPGMPPGSPGMEVGTTAPYDIFAIHTDGTLSGFAQEGEE